MPLLSQVRVLSILIHADKNIFRWSSYLQRIKGSCFSVLAIYFSQNITVDKVNS
jgi:hypothetical protein